MVAHIKVDLEFYALLTIDNGIMLCVLVRVRWPVLSTLNRRSLVIERVRYVRENVTHDYYHT
jgi:hypothetical protein